MNTPDQASRWLRPFRPARPHTVVEHDAADLGTCFGLEMSLDQPPAAAETTAATRRAPWWAPWAQRDSAPGHAD
jgi:hypothetical protein